MNVLLLVILLWSPVEVHSQTVPYLTFMGETLPNHSYVDLSLVGHYHDGLNSLQCHTDLVTCCSRTQGAHHGDWYFPSGDRLDFPGDPGDIYESRVAQRVDLRRRKNGDTSGIYRCDIETNAVHSDNSSDTTTTETVYVGLYDTGGRCDYCFMLTLIVKNDVSMCPILMSMFILTIACNSQILRYYHHTRWCDIDCGL